MQNLLITNFTGIQSANRKPPLDACDECLNLDLRENTGDLVIQHGYNLLYSAPTSALVDRVPLGFQTFVVPSVRDSSGSIQPGREVLIAVERATLTPQSLALSPASSQSVIALFARPYWTGDQWVDAWQNLLETYTTRVAVSTLSGSIIDLDTADPFFTSGSNVRGWTVSNLSRSPQDNARVADATFYGGRAQLTLSSEVAYTASDELLIQRNFIPYEYIAGNASASADDVVFHKVLDSLRIGFGNHPHRLGLSVGYLNKVFNFNAVEALRTSTGSVSDALATVNRLTVEPYNVTGMEPRILATVYANSGNVQPGQYGVRLTGVLDGYQEMLLAQTTVDTTNYPDALLYVNPEVNFGSLNPRLTALNVWISSGSVTPASVYYLYQQYPVADVNHAYTTGSVSTLFNIGSNGYLTLSTPPVTGSVPGAPEYNRTPNAASPTGLAEANSTAGWVASRDNSGFTVIESQSTYKHGGSFALKSHIATNYADHNGPLLVVPPLVRDNLTTYHLRFWAMIRRSDAVDVSSQVVISVWNSDLTKPGQECTALPIFSTESWTYYDVVITPAEYYELPFTYLQIALPSGTDWVNLVTEFYLDEVSVQGEAQELQTDALGGKEMLSTMGYEPTQPLALSWDSALVAKGETYGLNPYVEQAYKNRVFYSPRSGAGASLYDVLVPEFYYDVEKWDNDDCVAMVLSPALDLYILRKNSIQLVNSDTGVSQNIKIGDGLVSKRGVFSFGDVLFFNGKFDIYAVQNVDIRAISDSTIRDRYRALSDAQRESAISVGEKNSSAYRTAFSTGEQYIFTARGWVEASRGVVPSVFGVLSDSTVLFSASGSIYEERQTSSASVAFLWRSVPMDNLLIQEVPFNTRFHVHRLAVRYTASTPFALDLYRSDVSSVVPFQTWVVPAGVDTSFTARTHLGADTRRFQIAVRSADANTAPNTGFVLSAVSALWKPIPTGIR